MYYALIWNMPVLGPTGVPVTGRPPIYDYYCMLILEIWWKKENSKKSRIWADFQWLELH